MEDDNIPSPHDILTYKLEQATKKLKQKNNFFSNI